MKREKLIKNFIPFIVALASVIILLMWCLTYAKPGDTQYQVVFMGDSIIGNTQDSTSIPVIVEADTGYRVLNAGFGGSCMANIDDELQKTNMQDVLSMNNLAISICNQNFGMQNASIEALDNSNYLFYFASVLDKLKNTDFESAEILLIEHGVNDYLAGTSLDNSENPYDAYTFGGSIRLNIEMLQKKYPNLRIILVTPTYCVFPAIEGATCENTEFGGGYLNDYVDFEIELAEKLGIEVIDNYHDSEINAQTSGTYLYDGLHPNAEGRKLLGERIASYLMTEGNNELTD